jgi:predicted nucleotidyltransferase
LQKIPEMKVKAFDFATEVVGDVNRMAEAFGKGALPDDLMIASWNDLKLMRYAYLSLVII